MSIIFAPDLRSAFDRVGQAFPDCDPKPGRIHRFGKNHSAWIKVFSDQDGAVFGDWRTGDNFVWQREREGQPPNTAELAAIRQKAEEARKAAEAEREAGYQEAAKKAAATWQAAAPASGHPYLPSSTVTLASACFC